MNTTVFACGGDLSLLELLSRQKIFVENPCDGRGICGKCKVKLISGSLPPLSSQEKQLLSIKEQEDGIRLACCVYPRESITLEIRKNEECGDILSGGLIPEYVFKPAVYKNTSKSDKLYGLAVDIGTTTVVVSLTDLLTGRIVGTQAGINAQKSYGMDVLTRISYVLENPGTGLIRLQKSIVDCINGLILNLCEKNNIDSRHIYDITVAANPTMVHLLLGVDPSTIGRSPYVPVFSNSLDLPAKETGLICADSCRLYCLPGVSAYIGSDIVAGAYASGLGKEEGNVLFIDIGTNGEILLASGRQLTACSCAAGPALEGMNISAGIRAVSGAIEDVEFEKCSFSITTVGNKEPIGVCGSGVMAAVRELLAAGLLKTGGALYNADDFEDRDCRRDLLWAQGREKGVYLYRGKKDISITQKDIRQVQLAKCAISSGFHALLEIAGLDMSELDKVIVAGQFGSRLPAKSLVGVGLIPDGLSEKVKYIGNSAHSGAYVALVSEPARKEMDILAARIEYKELSVLPDFEDLFIECMDFPY